MTSRPAPLPHRAEPIELGSPQARLSFGGSEDTGSGAGGRYLRIDGRNAYELSFSCGTCALLFQRQNGAVETFSPMRLSERLTEGLTGIEHDLVLMLDTVLPPDRYVPLLMESRPVLVHPMRDGDYFANEQLEHRGPNHFTGLPEFPRTRYYRGGTWRLDSTTTLFEFVVPMVPPHWNDPDRVRQFEALLGAGERPTALALSLLDVTQPADSDEAHWGLLHFLVDGHHKTQAAAEADTPIRLLSLVASNASLATADELDRALDAVRSPPSSG